MQNLINQLQQSINELNAAQFDMLKTEIGLLIEIVEDHEKDIKKLADELDELKKLSQKD